MKNVNDAMKAFNCDKEAWTAMCQISSLIEERMMALEEVVKNSLADPVRNAAQGVATGMPQPRTYASVVASQITKTAVRIRIDGADKLQPEELLSKAKGTFKDHALYDKYEATTPRCMSSRRPRKMRRLTCVNQATSKFCGKIF